MSPATTPIANDRGRGRVLGDPELLRAMADSATYGAAGEVTVRETHASWVFLIGSRAFKVKKPVTLRFLDYGTLARRQVACREEVRVNSELAPDVYLGVRAIVPSAAGAFELAGEDDPRAVEYAVEMRRFDDADTLAGRIAASSPPAGEIASIARRIAAFHRAAPVAPGGGASDVLDRWRANLSELAAEPQARDWDLEGMGRFGEAFVAGHGEEIEQRRRSGFVRDGHGDLRCEHVLLAPGLAVLDRIEFDPALRRGDVAGDVAFLAMDLEALGQPRAAEELVRVYRREGLDLGSDAVLWFYAAQRAIVRAKVALIAAAESREERSSSELERANAMWRLAERLCWRARMPLALVVCGPAASGKSTLAAELSRRSGIEVLSSDALRKSAAGIAATERGAPELYSQRFTHIAYEQLGIRSARALARRGAIIVDATCRMRDQRARLLARLRSPGVTVLLVHLAVPLEVALRRSELRLRDPLRVSDATSSVVAEQYRSFEALDELPSREVLQLDAERALDEQVDEVARALDGALSAVGSDGGGG